MGVARRDRSCEFSAISASINAATMGTRHFALIDTPGIDAAADTDAPPIPA
jgi:hypothetical protein